MNPTFTPVYHDRLLRLLLVPILGILYRHIGEPSPLLHLLRDPVYYVDLLVCILLIGLLWVLIKKIIERLDHHYSWMTDFFQRLAIQALIVYSIAIFYTLFTTFIYNDLLMRAYRKEVYNINFSFVIDVPVALLMHTIIQLFYYILYIQTYYQQELNRRSEPVASLNEKEAPLTRKNILVYFGKSLLPVALDEIAYCHKIGEVTLVRTIENQDYRVDQTLEQLQTTLPARTFHRLNRQMIAHLEAVREVKTDASGKLLVMLEPPYDTEVNVSRKKAAVFKNWLNG